MPSNEFERELKRISNLVQNKGLTEEELTPIAHKNLIIRNFKKNPIFDKSEEQKLAEEKFSNYLQSNEIETASDIDSLSSLVYLEVFEKRIQKDLNEQQEKNKYAPDKLVKSLVDVQDQKAQLKIKLGIDKKAEEKDDFSALQLLQKRVDKYIQEHKNEFTIGLGFECEQCKHKNWESFLVYKQVKDFRTIKHPYFAGRWLFNYEIIKDVMDGKITKEQAYRYLMCSGNGKFYKPQKEDRTYCLDYINYCIENFVEITDCLEKNEN